MRPKNLNEQNLRKVRGTKYETRQSGEQLSDRRQSLGQLYASFGERIQYPLETPITSQHNGFKGVHNWTQLCREVVVKPETKSDQLLNCGKFPCLSKTEYVAIKLSPKEVSDKNYLYVSIEYTMYLSSAIQGVVECGALVYQSCVSLLHTDTFIETFLYSKCSLHIYVLKIGETSIPLYLLIL